MNPSESCNTINGIVIMNIVVRVARSSSMAILKDNRSTSLCRMTMPCQGNLVGVPSYVNDTNLNIPMSVFVPEKGKPYCEPITTSSTLTSVLIQCWHAPCRLSMQSRNG
jgi:hypothetical protein